MYNPKKKKMMKKRNLIFMVICLFSGLGAVYAQHPQTDVHDPLDTFDIALAGDIDEDGVDTATVNAIMPYRITPDSYFSSRPGTYDPSGFQWTWTGGNSPTNTAAGALTETEPGIYEDTVIHVIMDAATGDYTLGVAEMSYPKSGVGCIDATPSEVNVVVVDRPTMTLNENDTTGGCSFAQDTFEFNFTGSAPWYVAYTVKAWDNVGAQVGTTLEDTAYVELVDGGLIFTDPQLTTAAGGSMAGVENFSIEIDGLWDSYSWRALNRADANVMSSYDVNPGADNDLAIFIYPTPETNDIKQLKIVH
jgi:hypothetical protein